MSENRPSHHLYLVTEKPTKEGKQRAFFHEIAPLWTSEKGNLSGEIPEGMTLSGRIVVMAASKKPEAEQQNEAALSDK